MLCFDCPRMCGVDRSAKEGFCGQNDKIRVAKIIENFMWEEPCVSGEKGALAIFFAGCNLRCEFCQNYKISHRKVGKEYTPQEFKQMLLSYDLSTFSSIDLITPSHFSSALIEALAEIEFPIPVVWNSSGYENEEVIEKLADIVDVFLPDLKYFDGQLSLQHSKAVDYFDKASKAIKMMRKCKPNNVFENGVLKEGVLIRHLVLPNCQKDSQKVLDFIKREIDSPLVSIMSQFTPTGKGSLTRKLYPLEYKCVLSYAEKIGLTDGYFQEMASSGEDFIPEF